MSITSRKTADAAKAAVYDLFTARNGGTVARKDIEKASGWKATTVATYMAKLWNGLLKPLGDGQYEVRLPRHLDRHAFISLCLQSLPAPLVPDPPNYDYDIALSFAGEDRPYVDHVARILRAFDVRVFYDTYEQHSLWGKDLYAHLDEVYRLKSHYCVMFLSKHYRAKLWTDHERKSAQARAFKERVEYILPIRLDGTEIPGVPPTIGYLEASKFTPEEIANMICAKIGFNTDVVQLLDRFKHELPGYIGRQEGSDLVFLNPTEDNHTVRLSILMLREALRADQLFYFTDSSIFIQ